MSGRECQSVQNQSSEQLGTNVQSPLDDFRNIWGSLYTFESNHQVEIVICRVAGISTHRPTTVSTKEKTVVSKTQIAR